MKLFGSRWLALNTLFLLALGTPLGCSDDDRPDASVQADASGRADSGVIAEAEVGPAGGTVSGPGISLEIPAGALSAAIQVRITPVATGPTLPENANLAGPIFKLEPEGTTFASDVTITLDVDRARVPTPPGEESQIAVMHAAGGGPFIAVGWSPVTAAKATGTIRSFSLAAAVYGDCRPRRTCAACAGVDQLCRFCPGSTVQCIRRESPSCGVPGPGITDRADCPACEAGADCVLCTDDVRCSYCGTPGSFACGTRDSEGSSCPAGPIERSESECVTGANVTVSAPEAASVFSGGTLSIAAEVSSGYPLDRRVTWTAQGGGAFDSNISESSVAVTYTAPVVTQEQTVMITATSILDPTKSASTMVTVRAGEVTGVSVTANPQTVPSQGTSALVATVAGTGDFDRTVNWSLTPASKLSSPTSIGDGVASVTFTAFPVTQATTVVARATSAQDPSKFGEVTLTVEPGATAGCTPIAETPGDYNNFQLTLAGGFVYWPTRNNRAMVRAPVPNGIPSAGAPEVVFTGASDFPGGAALLGDHLYYPRGNLIERVDLSQTPFPAPESFASNAGFPDRLATDGTYLYTGSGDEPGRVVRYDLAEPASPLVLGSAEPNAYAVTVDATHAYWALFEFGQFPRIRRSPKGSSAPVDVVAAADHPGVPTGRIARFAVDGTHVYYALVRASGFDNVVEVFRKSADGTGAPQALSPARVIADVLGLGVDATHVYWTEDRFGPPVTGGNLMRAPKDGSAAPVEVAASGRGSGGELALDAANVYWLALDRLCRIAK